MSYLTFCFISKNCYIKLWKWFISTYTPIILICSYINPLLLQKIQSYKGDYNSCNLLQSKIIIFLHHKAMLFWKNHLVTKLILICSWYLAYIFTMLENTDQNSVDFFIKSLRISSVWRSFIFYWREDKEHGRYAPKSACITPSWPSAHE